jgi:hypothetical protein
MRLECGDTALCEVEIGTKEMDSEGLGLREVDVVRTHRTDHDHRLAGAYDRDVEPALSTGDVERAEALVDPPLVIRTVGDAQEDHVALVALNVFEILDEERLGTLEIEEFLEREILPTEALEFVLNRALLPGVHRDHTETLLGRPAKMLEHHASGRRGLDGVEPARVARALSTLGDVDEANARVGRFIHSARESNELSFVEMSIGEGDQGLSSAAIVPAQALPSESECTTDVEDALIIREPVVVVGFALVVFDHSIEEIRRRKLFLIARHDELGSSEDRADRVERADLRRLVEDHEIEADLAPAQMGADRERAHHQTWLDALEDCRALGDEIA